MKAASYDVQPYPGAFKSGWPRWMTTFLGADRKVIARRIRMEFTSKQSGAPDKAFSRQDWVDHDTAPPRTILSRQQTNDADASALLNEQYASETAA